MAFRVLYDLALAGEPSFAGIPQETRLLYFGLAQSDQIELAGLLRPHLRSDIRRGRLNTLDAQARFLGPFLGERSNNHPLIARALRRLHPGLALGYELLSRSGARADIELADPSLNDIIWRNFFATTLPAQGRPLMAEKQYYLSKLGNDRIAAASVGYIPTPRLDTSGFDFLVTQDVKVLKAHPRTIKVVRYHDGLPVTAADTIKTELHIKIHVSLVSKAAPDSIFVCNSTSAQSDLQSIAPFAASRSVVIPNVIPEMERVSPNPTALRTIVETRMTGATAGDKRQRRQVAAWFGKDPNAIPQYILSVATVEPRKNYIRLIEAWREQRRRTDSDTRLMIVGKLGWGHESTLAAMQPFIERGELVLLSNVRQTELPYLYSMASVFAYPSVAEGFGMPPAEAMKCGCPVVLSDVAAHQFMAGDAAFYFDPYDVQGMAEALELALASKELRNLLVERGYRNVKRFTTEAVVPQWEAFFADVARERKLVPAPRTQPASLWQPVATATALNRNIETLRRAAQAEGATFAPPRAADRDGRAV